MQAMGSESYCSLSLVEPLLNKLMTKCLLPSDQDTPSVYEFKAAAHVDTVSDS